MSTGTPSNFYRFFLAFILIFFLASCEKSNNGAADTNTVSISGSLTGLPDGGSVALRYNDLEAVNFTANGSISITSAADENSSYLISIAALSNGVVCTISNGSGSTTESNITNIAVICEEETYSIGGILTGLPDNDSITIQNNNSDSITLDINGNFRVASSLAQLSSYSVAITTQPNDANCTISNSTGTIGTANVSNISIICIATNSGSISGKILNFDNGSAISGATITTGENSTVSGGDGSYFFDGIDYSDRTIVTVKKGNFARQSKVIRLNEVESQVVLSISMLPIDHTEVFDPSVTQIISDPNSTTSVDLGALNALKDANDNLPTGDVTAKLSFINSNQDATIMPGNFVTDDEVNLGDFRFLETSGALTITINDANGNQLDLSNGQTATIRFPLQLIADNARTTTPPATAPLYYFNEEIGKWVKEGSATLMDTGFVETSYYEGTVTHLSTWSVDSLYDQITIAGCVENLIGTRLKNISVTVTGDSYIGTSSSSTNNEGLFDIIAKQNSSLFLTASKNGSPSNTVDIITTTVNIDLTAECLLISESSASIKLTWGENPRDLDSHLVTPDEHISYQNLGSLTESPFAKLDIDDTSSYGPEIITITDFSSVGSYKYTVDHFSGSSTITDSPARVELNLFGNVTIFTPPLGQDGEKAWDVFEIVVNDQGNIQVNTLNIWNATRP